MMVSGVAFGDAAIFQGATVKILKPILRIPESGGGSDVFDFGVPALASSYGVTVPNAYCLSGQAWAFSDGVGTMACASVLTSSLANGAMWIGNGSGLATAVTMSGDVTITNLGVTAIGADKVTNAMLDNMAANTIKCNNTGGSVNPIDCTTTQATAMLNVAVGDSGSGGTKGLVPAPASGDAAKVLSGAMTYLSMLTNPMTTTGDIIYSSSGTGTPTRLGIGSTGDNLSIASGIPAWKSKVYTRVSSNVTGTIGTGGSVQVFEIEDEDALNCYNNSTGVWTAPRDGLYLFEYNSLTVASNTATNIAYYMQFDWSSGPTSFRGNTVYGNGSSSVKSMFGNVTLRMTSGQTVTVSAIATTATTRIAGPEFNYYTVTSVD